MRMRRAALIRTFYACTLLLVLLTAYTAKSLHTHPAEYYASLLQTQHEDHTPDLLDDCPLCHFHFFTYTTSTEWILLSDFRLLTTIYQTEEHNVDLIDSRELSLRAPPAMGL